MVNNSTSGDFTIPTGTNCADPTTGHVPGKIECTTASDGTATAAFKTTMQPGDNFAVAASLSSIYRDGLNTNPSSGTQLLNMDSNVIHISGETNEDQVPGVRTEMLTVWRKLHIEVDSMGEATGNNVTGYMAENGKVSTGTRTVQVTANPPLESNRFENGRMAIDGRFYPIVDATDTQDANTADTVTIRVYSAFNITTASTFALYDDDDMDDNDVEVLKGDQGDDVDEPDFGLLISNDVPCSNSFDTNNCNILVSAYVTPLRDLAGSHQNTDFYINATDANLVSIRMGFFQNRQYEASVVLWTVYLLGAYQYTEQDDSDPDLQGAILGKTDGVSANDGEGSVIFNEVNRTHEYNVLDILNPNVLSWTTRPVNRRFTIAHEVGHLFGGTHEDYTTSTTNAGLMAQSTIRLNPPFTDATINKIRGGQYTDQTGVIRRITHP